jgi:hypothetical protein
LQPVIGKPVIPVIPGQNTGIFGKKLKIISQLNAIIHPVRSVTNQILNKRLEFI